MLVFYAQEIYTGNMETPLKKTVMYYSSMDLNLSFKYIDQIVVCNYEYIMKSSYYEKKNPLSY